MDIRTRRSCERPVATGALVPIRPDCFDGTGVAGPVCRCERYARRPMQRRIGAEIWLICERCLGRIARLDRAHDQPEPFGVGVA